MDNTVHQVVLSRIERHSKKPEEVRRRIEQLIGDVPRVELFARQRAPGWDVWGDHVAGTISLEGWDDEALLLESAPIWGKFMKE